MYPRIPIMVVLAVTCAGASPRRALAVGGASPRGVAVLAEDKNPLNALAKILENNDAARADAGRRIEDFLLKADATGKSFIAAGVDTAALGKAARDWALKTGPTPVATLYFVIGPGGETPIWAKGDPVLGKTFKPGMQWEGKLRKALQQWIISAQIDRAAAVGAATAFLNTAAEEAKKVFYDQRTQRELEKDIAADDRTAVIVPTPGGSSLGLGLGVAARKYLFDDLYVQGAKVGENVYGEDDAAGRRISIKIYTRRNDKKELINEVGIFDITDRNDIFGRYFPMTVGERTFELDDRKPGEKKYTLRIETKSDNSRGLFFGRPGKEADEPGTINTSVEDLLMERAGQAGTNGHIVKVPPGSGQEFYVVPQGGERGALALLPKQAVDARGKENVWNLLAQLYAEVSVLNAEGRTVDISGKPHLGKIGEDEYHLELNNGTWEVKDGAGDPPVSPTTKAAAGDAATPGDATAGRAVTTSGKLKTSAWSAACTEDIKIANHVRFKAGQWAFMFNTVQADHNQFRICINNDQLMFVPNGVLVKNGIRVEKHGNEDYLLIDYAEVNGFVGPQALSDGQVSQEDIPGEKSQYPKRYKYYIPTRNLTKEVVAVALAVDQFTPLPRLASVMLEINVDKKDRRPKTMDVYIHEADKSPGKVLKAVDQALKVFGTGTPLLNAYLTPDGNKSIATYISSEVQKYNKDTNLPLDAHFRISLHILEEMKKNDDWKQIILPSYKTYKDGVAKWDELGYCGLGKLGLHFETYAQHLNNALH